MPKTNLLATAATVEGIEQMIRRCWYSDSYTVNRDTLAIEHPTKVPSGHIVTRKGSRFRFEAT